MANVQVTRVALTTGAATTTQDITIGGFGTPTAALFICTEATFNNSVASDAFMSIGFTDGTTSKAIASNSEDNQGTTNSARTTRNAVIAKPDDIGFGIDLEFTFNSWITDGVRIEVSDQSPSAFLCTVILFKGTSNAYVGDVGLGNGTSPIDVTAPGFEPDLVFALNAAGGAANHSATHFSMSFGVGINDGVDTQRLISQSTNDGQANGYVTAAIRNDVISSQILSGGQQWLATIGSYDASGFSITPSADSFGDFVNYLAIKFTDNLNIDLFDATYPSSGNYVESTPGFQPDFGLLAFSTGPSARNTPSRTNAGALSLTAFDDTSIYSSCVSDEDGPTTTESHSYSDTNLKALTDMGATTQISTSSYSLDSGGWTFTRSGGGADTTLGFGLAIGAIPPVTVNLGTSNETDTAYPVIAQIGGQVEVGISESAEVAYPVLAGTHQDVVITQSKAATDSPVIRGTAEVDHTAIDVTVDGTQLIQTKSLSGVWRAPTNPWYEPEQIALPTIGLGDLFYINEPIINYTHDGNLLMIFRRGGDHASNDGRLFSCISTDHGQTWGSENLIYDSPTGYDTRNQAGGVDPVTGRVICFIRVYDVNGPTTVDIGYCYSDDHGVTWSSFISLHNLFPQTELMPFGPMVRTVNGLMQTFHFFNDAWVLFSKDGGLTWGDISPIHEDWPEGGIGIGEPSAIAIDMHRIVCILRDNNAVDSYRYVKSSDGGKTWSAVSDKYLRTNGTVTFSSPAHGIRVEDDLLLAWHTRSTEFKMFTNRMNIEDFWTTPQDAWLPTGATEFRTEFSTAGTFVSTDYGYPWFAYRAGHEYTVLMAWYDLDDGAPGSGGNKIATFPRLI